MPLLGVGFGRLVTVEAAAFVTRPGKGPHEDLLRVLRINGRTAPPDLRIPWT